MGGASDIPYISAVQQERPGFDLSNASRHLPQSESLAEFVKTRCRKTGTTISGCVCKDGVVLAADTRATMGPVVYEKNALKLHKLADNIYAAGAGCSADLLHVGANIEADMKLFARQTKTMPRVSTVVHRLSHLMAKNGGNIVVAMVIGGVSPDGACDLATVAPDGTKTYLPYLSMGSGGHFAMSILEAEYRDDMDVEEGFKLVTKAIKAGVLNDEASGNHVDAVIIRKECPRNAEMRRHVFNVDAGDRKYTGVQLGATKFSKEIITPTEQQFDINAALHFTVASS